MKTQNIERYLNSFGKYIVQQSRTNLTKGSKKYGTHNVTGKLYKSINFKVTTDANGFSVKFYMSKYGTFLDKGVKGTNSNYIENKDTNYSYKTKQPPTSIIEKWIKKRGIKGRVDKDWKSAGNKGGQFISHKSLAFLISRSIKMKGIKSTSFFQRPMQLGLKRFSKDLLGAIKEDVMKELNNK